MSDPELAKADEKLRKISASEEKRQLARMREKALLDWNSLQVDAREEGRQEGLAEGKQLGIEQGRHEGIREAQIQFLRHLLVSRRYSVQELHDLTQAPLELIEELLKQSLHPSKDQS